MGRLHTYTIKFECKFCHFHVEIKGSEKNIINISTSCISHHNEYCPGCKASKREDFSIQINEKEDKFISDAREIIRRNVEKTNKIFNEFDGVLDDIIGNEIIKEVVKSRINDYIEYKDMLKARKMHLSPGLILVGIQGTGKTNILKAVIKDVVLSNDVYRKKYRVIIMESHDFMASATGETGRKIEAILDELREYNKSNNTGTILLIDEIENLFPSRKTDRITSLERTRTGLANFGGMNDDHTIFVMGTANSFDKIDEDILVPGRFGNPLPMKSPNPEERYDIFKKHTKDIPMTEDISLEFINETLNSYTGRDLFSFSGQLYLIYKKKEKLYFSAIERGEVYEKPIINRNDIVQLSNGPVFSGTTKKNLDKIQILSNSLAGYINNENGDGKKESIYKPISNELEKFIDKK